MPKVKEMEVHPMTRLLYGYDVRASSLASTLGCTYPTAKRRIEDPSRLTLGELKAIRRRYAIPVDEIRRAVLP